MELSVRKNGGIGAEMENPAFETDTLSPNAIRLTQYDINHLTVHQAAREGDVAIIERLMEKYPTNQQRKKRLNARDDNKLTPLHYAARYTHYHMLQYLLKNGANPHAKAEDGATALHFLAKYKKKRITVEGANDQRDSSDSDEDELPPEETFSCLKLLVDNGAHVNAKDAMGLTSLHHACTRRNTKAVRELIICAGIGMETADNQGMTALHLACLYNKKSIVRILIDAGANMRARDKDMTTPLLLACAEGGLRIAELLLEKADEFARNLTNEEISKEKDPNYAVLGAGGAAELLKDTDGEKNLPLHLAIENGHLELVVFCINKAKAAGLGSMVEIQRSREETCLHLAVLSNNIEIVTLLMQHGADVNARNSTMATPLFVAAQYNAHTIVKYLLDHGANVDMKNNDFFTPLLMASRHGHLETIAHLLEHHADITETDKDDKTCIIWAAEEDRTDALSLLLQHPKGRALIEERDRYNNTALHMASSKGHVNVVKFLLQKYRAPADIKNDDDRTTLHMAALNGNDLIIPELIARDRTILNAGDEDANAALHLAAMGGNVKCVETLIQLGANIELRNAKQWTPLDSAAAYGWEKPARALLEAGAAVQPRGKIKVSPIHLSCRNGHLEMVNLLLAWRADVTFRAADGRNALDFAIDSNQKDCVMALLRHATWKDSLRNSVSNPVNGRMSTPMRKLIKKMPDLAEVVYNQCITDNGKKPEDDNYKITLLYEFLDDMYASSAWSDYSVVERKESIYETADDAMYAKPVIKPETERMKDVYDDNGHLTPEANTYCADSDELQKNHPLKIMVSSKREELLLHPVVTGLLNYKWRRFGRYVYYSSLLLFVIYLILLNVYMMTIPRPYEINWVLVVNSRDYIINNDSMGQAALVEAGLNPEEQSLACYYYRQELIDADGRYPAGCHTLPDTYFGLKWTILVLSAFNLLREFFQLANQRLRYVTELTNFVEISLYVLSILTTIDYPGYYIDPGTLANTGNHTQLIEGSADVMTNFQTDTGLRQEWQSEVGAFAIFLSWMGLLLFIQKIPYLGIFVVMFTDILKTFAQFFFVFIFFIFGFAFAFNILLGNQYVFATWYDSMIKTTVMMIGELDYGSIFFGYKEDTSYFANIYTNSVSYVLFTIFLIVMTIIIMNLLVGLAVGDIIEIQEHATLERLGMTVDLALDVEFTLPEFLRKRVCLRQQTIEVNKYRKANWLKKFFFEDSALTVENITKSLNREKGEQDEMRDSLDRVLTGLGRLRNRLTDVISEQSEVKMGIFGIRSQLRESRLENKTAAKELKEAVGVTRETLGGQLGQASDGLSRLAQEESNTTRTRVTDAQTLIRNLQGDLTDTRTMITEVKHDLESRMDRMHKELMESKGKDLEEGLRECNNRIDQTRSEVLHSLEEMKMILVKEKYMTSV